MKFYLKKKNDLKEGQGIYTYSNGEIYEGNYSYY